MAGGKITRIVGGTNSIECETWTVYTDEFSAYAGQGSHFTADGGTNLGEPKEAPSSYTYFEKGWWTDEAGKEIKEARLGDKVQFHLKMKNIKSPEGKKVNLELREWDEFNFLLYILSFTNKELVGHKNSKGYETINIVSVNSDNNEVLTDWKLNKNSEIIVSLLLDEDALIKMIANDEGRDLELYFRCRYIDENNFVEVAELPWENWNYLRVKPKPITESIILVHASYNHPLPAIYSSENGSPWYVVAMKNGMYTNKINTLSKPYGSDYKKEITAFEKKAYKIAIRNLEKGELIFNTGRKGTTSRFYDLDISEIDKEFKTKIKVGVNRGTGIPGETSRGISQLEAQSQRGIAGTIKTVGEIAGLFGVLSDMAALLRGAADHKIPPPSIIPPFVTMEVERIIANLEEGFIEFWNKELQKAIMGGKKETKSFLERSGFDESKNLKFKVIDMTEQGIMMILNKEVYEINNPDNPKSLKFIDELQGLGSGSFGHGILIQSIDENDKYNRPTTNHYIHAIFVNNVKL